MLYGCVVVYCKSSLGVVSVSGSKDLYVVVQRYSSRVYYAVTYSIRQLRRLLRFSSLDEQRSCRETVTFIRL